MRGNKPPEVRLNQNALYFPPPLDRTTFNRLQLTNMESVPVTFKLRTTFPRRYIVQPRHGVVEADSTSAIEINYNPSSEPEDPSTISDQFQLEVRCLTPEEQEAWECYNRRDQARARQLLGIESNVTDIISEVWKRGSNMQVTKYKLKCYFDEVPGEESSKSKSYSDASLISSVAKSAYSSPMDLNKENEKLRQELTELSQKYDVLKAKLEKSEMDNGRLRKKFQSRPPITLPLWIVLLLLVCSTLAGRFLAVMAMVEERDDLGM